MNDKMVMDGLQQHSLGEMMIANHLEEVFMLKIDMISLKRTLKLSSNLKYSTP
jgi:hypothetical protein